MLINEVYQCICQFLIVSFAFILTKAISQKHQKSRKVDVKNIINSHLGNF